MRSSPKKTSGTVLTVEKIRAIKWFSLGLTAGALSCLLGVTVQASKAYLEAKETVETVESPPAISATSTVPVSVGPMPVETEAHQLHLQRLVALIDEIPRAYSVWCRHASQGDVMVHINQGGSEPRSARQHCDSREAELRAAQCARGRDIVCLYTNHKRVEVLYNMVRDMGDWPQVP